jgi:antitoxin VapB
MKARVFQSGNSQAVRLPKQFRVSTGELEIFRRGRELVLIEPGRPMERAFEILAEFPVDGTLDERIDTPPQTRQDWE